MDYYFAKDLEEQIESRLYEIHEQTPIQIFDNKRPQRDLDYKFLYDSDKFCLPFSIRNALTINRVDRFYFDIYFNAIKNEHPSLVSNGVEEAIKKQLKECYPPELLCIVISDKINSLVFQYKNVLRITKERDNLQGSTMKRK